MPIALPGDLDVFFDADGFGERVTYTAPGSGVPVTTTALWDRGLAQPGFGEGQVALRTNRFALRDDLVGEPEHGATILIVATGEVFTVEGEAEASLDGATWTCGAVPA